MDVGRVALDGTKIGAAASKDANRSVERLSELEIQIRQILAETVLDVDDSPSSAAVTTLLWDDAVVDDAAVDGAGAGGGGWSGVRRHSRPAVSASGTSGISTPRRSIPSRSGSDCRCSAPIYWRRFWP